VGNWYNVRIMREIEIKAKIQNPEAIRKKLEGKGIKLGKKLKQHDVVFGEPGKGDNQFGANWLRIRTENDTITYFTLKSSVVGHLDSIEHETIVEDAKELELIIKQPGFKLYSELTKYRQKAQHGKVEICIDHVPGLGDFIELEKIFDQSSNIEHGAVVDELWEFFESLGIKKEHEVYEGYDVLERKLRGL
jgi:adenylate cyclase, class 2